MSDIGRQSFTDKTTSAVKPDSQKNVVEQTTDTLKGTLDSAASTLLPNSEKSNSQAMGDTLSGNQNDNQDSLLGKLGVGGKNI